jgi:GTP-sensing pleiotropic transcriptional regulator CodY
MSNFNADELKQKLHNVINESKVDRRVGVYFLRTAEDKFAAADLRALHEYAAHLPGVQMVRTMTVTASPDPEVLARELRKEKLNTVVRG